jgi:N-carbamoyl-L-amino-acid hydrolase
MYGHNDPSRFPMRNLKTDGARLWGTLMETAAFGSTPRGGICRLTLTDHDLKVRQRLQARAEALGAPSRATTWA